MSAGNMEKVLRLMADKNASDVYLSANTPILIRINGQILHLSDQVLTPPQIRQLLGELLTPQQFEEFDDTGELNLSVSLPQLGGRTLLVDARNQHIGYSPLFERAPGFRNALVQSIAGGNTMVFNRAARDLLRRAGEDVEAVTHDWWAYMLVTSCGGEVHYDPYPTVRYRQHGSNQFGSNANPVAQLRRLRLLIQGRFRGWVDANVRALQRVRHLMTPDNQRVLDEFVQARQCPLPARLARLRRVGIFRQTTLGNLGLTLAALINRL